MEMIGGPASAAKIWPDSSPEIGRPTHPRPRLLPFHELNEYDFECLTAAIAKLVDGHQSVTLHGRRGQKDHGIDVLAGLSTAEPVAYQAKRYSQFKPADLQEAVNAFTSNPYGVRHLRIFVACETHDSKIVSKLKTLNDDLADYTIELRGRSELSELLRDQPTIVDNYFPHWKDVFCTKTSDLHQDLPAPSTWEDLPFPKDDLLELLTAEYTASERFPYELWDLRPPALSDVFVERIVLKDDSTSSHETRDQRPTERVGLSFEAAINEVGSGHVLFLGDPGVGKTSQSQHIIHQITGRWLRREGNPALREPVASVRILASDLAQPGAFGDLLAEAVNRRSFTSARIPSSILSRPVAGARWLVVVDGLDEIEDRDRRVETITRLADHLGNPGPHRLVIFSRPLPDPELELLTRTGIRTYVMRPFGQNDLLQFAHRWFVAQNIETAADQLAAFTSYARDPDHGTTLQNPLFATIALASMSLEPNGPLPQSRLDLLERFVTDLREARPLGHDNVRQALAAFRSSSPVSQMTMEDLDHLMGALASHALDTPTRLVDHAFRWVEERLLSGHKISQRQMSEVRRILLVTGMFVADGTDIRFIHRTFAEYLAARTNAKDIEAGRTELSFWVTKAVNPSSRNLAIFTLGIHLKKHPAASTRVIYGILDHPTPVGTSSKAHALTAAAQLLFLGVGAEEKTVAYVVEKLLRQGMGRFSGEIDVSALLVGFGPLQLIGERLQHLSGSDGIEFQKRIAFALAFARLFPLQEGALAVAGLYPHSNGDERLQILDGLEELGMPPHDRLALLADVTQNESASLWSRARAADQLMRAGQTEIAEGAFEQILRGPSGNTNAVVFTAYLWTEQKGSEAALRILEIIEHRKDSMSASELAGTAEVLAGFGPSQAVLELAEHALTMSDIVPDDESITDAVSAWLTASSLGPNHRRLLEVVKRNPKTCPDFFSDVMSALDRAGSPNGVMAFARELLGDPAASGYEITRAAVSLIGACGLDAIDEVLSATADRQIGLGAFVDILTAMADVGATQPAVSLAERVIADPAATSQNLAGAARILPRLPENEQQRLITHLRERLWFCATDLLAVAKSTIESKHLGYTSELLFLAAQLPMPRTDELLEWCTLWSQAEGRKGVATAIRLLNESQVLSPHRRAICAEIFDQLEHPPEVAAFWVDIILDGEAEVTQRIDAAERLSGEARPLALDRIETLLAKTTEKGEHTRLIQLKGWIEQA